MSDITLEAGEKLTSVSAGDIVRWVIGDRRQPRIGDAWEARTAGNNPKSHLRLRLDDPSLPAPLTAALFPRRTATRLNSCGTAGAESDVTTVENCPS